MYIHHFNFVQVISKQAFIVNARDDSGQDIRKRNSKFKVMFVTANQIQLINNNFCCMYIGHVLHQYVSLCSIRSHNQLKK